jgi:hypothetical protein
MIVTAGIDMIASPVGQSCGVTVLGNAPILDASGTYLQVSRDSWEMVLNEAHFLSCYKMGGADFSQAIELDKQFIMFCSAENSRLKSLGSFADVLDQRGSAQDRSQARYNTPKGGQQ